MESHDQNQPVLLDNPLDQLHASDVSQNGGQLIPLVEPGDQLQAGDQSHDIEQHSSLGDSLPFDDDAQLVESFIENQKPPFDSLPLLSTLEISSGITNVNYMYNL
jgi:hypothetical protein